MHATVMIGSVFVQCAFLQEELVSFVCCAVWLNALLPQRTKGNNCRKIELPEVR